MINPKEHRPTQPKLGAVEAKLGAVKQIILLFTDWFQGLVQDTSFATIMPPLPTPSRRPEQRVRHGFADLVVEIRGVLEHANPGTMDPDEIKEFVDALTQASQAFYVLELAYQGNTYGFPAGTGYRIVAVLKTELESMFKSLPEDQMIELKKNSISITNTANAKVNEILSTLEIMLQGQGYADLSLPRLTTTSTYLKALVNFRAGVASIF